MSMGYKLYASSIGEKAIEILDNYYGEFSIHHIFANTIYVKVCRDMIIITQKNVRSPYTINISQKTLETPFYLQIELRDRIDIEESKIRIGRIEIDLRNAQRYSSLPIGNINHLDDLREKIYEKMFIKGLNTIIILYSIPSSIIPILEIEQLRRFLIEVVYPFSRGDLEPLRKVENYRDLIGVGGGFTPSGDDFLIGFISFLNIIGEEFQIPKIMLDDEFLFSHTSWESAMFLKYAEDGFYDEHLHQLLYSIASRDEGVFIDSILNLARRGHTSGLDITLGVLTGLSSFLDYVKNTCLTEKLINLITGLS
ncbi:MAG: DUF2877 domain-containing protein [Candidatus Caldarchaeales archaeon]